MPVALPVTTPEVEPTAATVASLLFHVPPPASLRADVEPTHRVVVPEIDDGSAFMTATVVV
jgi:hypothetical protein